MTVSRYGAFSSPAFRWLWGSSLGWAGAQWMERVATSWLALQAGGSAIGVGVMLAARMTPALLFGLVSGTLADRWSRRSILIGTAALSAGLAVVLAAIVAAGAPQLWQIAAVAFFFGCLQVSDMPARQALAFDTVKRPVAVNALALNTVASRLVGAVGALTGGVILDVFGPSNTYYVVAGCFLLSLLPLLPLRLTEVRTRLSTNRPPFWQALAGAAQLIVTVPAVRTLALASVVCEVFAFSYMTILPTMVRDVLLAGPDTLGALTAASAIGATVAVVTLAWLPGTIRREPLLAAAFAGFGIGLVALSAAPNLPIALGIMTLVGASSALFDTLQQVLLQFAVPEEQRGRALGVWMFSIGSGPFGHLEAGALSVALGAPTALAVNGSLVLVGAVLLVVRAPAYRWQRLRSRLGV